jgi:hypothetical protein
MESGTQLGLELPVRKLVVWLAGGFDASTCDRRTLMQDIIPDIAHKPYAMVGKGNSTTTNNNNIRAFP